MIVRTESGIDPEGMQAYCAAERLQLRNPDHEGGAKGPGHASQSVLADRWKCQRRLSHSGECDRASAARIDVHLPLCCCPVLHRSASRIIRRDQVLPEPARICQRSPMMRLANLLWNGAARTTYSIFAIHICCSPFDGANRPRSDATSASPLRMPFAHENSDEAVVANRPGSRLTRLWLAISISQLPAWVGSGCSRTDQGLPAMTSQIVSQPVAVNYAAKVDGQKDSRRMFRLPGADHHQCCLAGLVARTSGKIQSAFVPTLLHFTFDGPRDVCAIARR